MKAEKILKLSVFFALFAVLSPFSIQAAAPDAITDLRCAFSGTPGSVWLSWSVPAGSPASYEVKYALSGINDGNYSLAYTYNQSWDGSAVKGFVGNLTQNQTWFFVMKAINLDGSSGISNVVWCQPNNPAESEALITVPVSNILNLQNESSIFAGQDFIVKGNSSVSGGSSVQKVEISFDNGETWQKTVATKAIDTGFEWEYNWKAPLAGDYLIKTRATDWLGAEEDPAEAVSIKVVQEQEQSSQEKENDSSGSDSQVQEQQRRALLIQIIQILIQILSRT